ncbi:anaphase-promoting complex subunit 10 [Stereum hirsutum FP-91666 SS1]|uniref:anaphase-promoting complex subunit 10 n=1 Tax=Stereum hirsutum (strain FP-91666) TaxID=721885 RepID=UPI000440F91D|nr:anaphase-promoting complex subunit 10 [Stereum hirsutum FP-91666 SS1]EIM91196.1 anaphase-promoting complex subunit 10 [Stereum hirsutum FP-91666 SS1]
MSAVPPAPQPAQFHPPIEGGPLIHPGRWPPNLPWTDIGHLAKWSVSSFKFGFGPECLQDNDPDTFWHSDGPQPHFVTIEFPRKMAVQKISLFLSFPLDDSYTPAALSIRAGTTASDLQEVRSLVLDKPDGWITFDVSAEPSDDGEGFKPVNVYILQVIIITNHMNGKDTHLRGMRILGPVEEPTPWDDPFPFVSVKFKMHEFIR